MRIAKLLQPLRHASFDSSLRRTGGIAGMRAISERGMREGYILRRRTQVFFGVRAWQDRVYLDEFAGMKDLCPEIVSVTVAFSDEHISKPASVKYPQLSFAKGFVHELAAAEMTGKYNNIRAFVAGPPLAGDASLRFLLRGANLSPTDVRYDRFG